jgi:polyhydroxyalkanoate synthase
MSPPTSSAEARPRGAAARAALDVMLTDAATDHGAAGRFLAPGAAAKMVGALARHPTRVASRVGGLGAELARVTAGRCDRRPVKGDRRFTDPAWEGSWLFRRLLQAYLAIDDTADALISDAQLDWRTERQVRFALGNVLDALAPTNYAISNPTVIKETVDQGGANLLRGSRRLLRDVARGQLPASVDTSKFEVGGNLALTPGAVVLRTELFELIQYRPQAKRVYQTPLLIVPPTINKYYILDLAPRRSVVEHLLSHGHQVFMVSWRNPDEHQSDLDLDSYAEAVLEAQAAAAAIAGAQAVNLAAACSGGLITAGVLGHLAAEGRLGEVASLALLVCALDNEQAGTTAAFTTREVAAAAIAESARKGYLEGSALAGVFAWLRPNDMIWNYVVNNYLLGKDPPAFDILYWNQDTVRLGAGLHRDFLMLALENSITRANDLEILGSGIDLARVDLDSYIVAGSNDHIVPWQNAYRGTQLLGGESRFILSTSGHIQALINPPSPDSRSSYRVAADNPADVETWLEHAVTKQGSWWPDYTEWLRKHSGQTRVASQSLGSKVHKPIADAPGRYVLAR